MTLSNSHLAYAKEYEDFESALEDSVGIRIPFPDHNRAYNYRQRLNKARAIEKKRNTEIYSKDDPAYGTTPYDELQCVIRNLDNNWFVYIVRRGRKGEAEPLSGLPEQEHLPDSQPKLESGELLRRLEPPKVDRR